MIRSWSRESEVRDALREEILQKLRRYRHKHAEYQACKDLYVDLYPSATQMLSDMPKAESESYEPERWAQKRWDYQLRLKDSLEEMSQSLAEIETMVEKLEGVYKAVIVRRYLLGETVEIISGKLNYSERQVRRVHKNAIERLVDNV